MRTCAACGCWRGKENEEGESQLYSPNRSFILCEPCWHEEDTMVEESGTNHHPDIVAGYEANMRNAS